MNRFVFKSYNLDKDTGTAFFKYGFEDGREFVEKVEFKLKLGYNDAVLQKALFLAFVVIGVSYFKTFPVKDVVLNEPLDEWQKGFFDKVYQEGLGQFAYENGLKRGDLAHFASSLLNSESNLSYQGDGILLLQSGGKDSILSSVILKQNNHSYDSLYVSSGAGHPSLIESDLSNLAIINRLIDREALIKAKSEHALNGHVPVTYIVQALALVQAILLNKDKIVLSIGHEGEEPHSYIDDLPVNHQWSKTWQAEQLFSEYVSRYVSKDIKIGSLLRGYSEIKIAKMFYEMAWEDYGYKFSSCNVANYKQGTNNSDLKWCGECPKCANAYLIFSPFIEPDKLNLLFGGQDLFAKDSLEPIYKGLLGVDNADKPFECVGSVDELRLAYGMSFGNGYGRLKFEVPSSSFDFEQIYPMQDWLKKLI